MISIRHLKRTLIVVAATFSLLFAQLAAAAYVCSGTAGVSQPSSVIGDTAPCGADALSSCNHLDTTQTALCAAQAHASREIAPDIRTSTPLVAAPSPWPSIFPSAPDDTLWQLPRRTPPGMTRAISPALSIRNCCYRI
ncbi:MAG: hypothetical protein EPN41_06340 [Candidimonas sp.]|nr:MAG: hypothetical protein EPN41_06340 [Candidimonas sp.]